MVGYLSDSKYFNTSLMKKIVIILLVVLGLGCQETNNEEHSSLPKVHEKYVKSVANVSNFIWSVNEKKSDLKGSFVFFSDKINSFHTNYFSNLDNAKKTEFLVKIQNITQRFIKKQHLKSISSDVTETEAIEGISAESEDFFTDLISLLDNDSVSYNVKNRMQDIILTLNNTGTDYLYKLHSQADSIDGKLVIDNSNIESDELKDKLVETIELEELDVFNSNQLMLTEKEQLLMLTYSLKTNLDPIIALFSSTNDSLKSATGFWSSLKRAFSKVVSAIVTVVTVAISTVASVIVGFSMGGIPGAIAGGTMGFVAGVKAADFFNCKWFLDYSYCQECKEEHPRGEFPC